MRLFFLIIFFFAECTLLPLIITFSLRSFEDGMSLVNRLFLVAGLYNISPVEHINIIISICDNGVSSLIAHSININLNNLR